MKSVGNTGLKNYPHNKIEHSIPGVNISGLNLWCKHRRAVIFNMEDKYPLIALAVEPGIPLGLESWTYWLQHLSTNTPLFPAFPMDNNHSCFFFSCEEPTFLTLGFCSIPSILSSSCLDVHYSMKWWSFSPVHFIASFLLRNDSKLYFFFQISVPPFLVSSVRNIKVTTNYV